MSTRTFRRATRREPCRACGGTDWCITFVDTNAVWCGRRESDTTCSKGGWMHWPDGRPDDWREQRAALPPPPPRPVYDPDKLHAVYGELLSRCPLTDPHRAAMAAKGFSEAHIERAGHGSLPESPAERARIAAEVQEVTGVALVGAVPGFYDGPVGVTIAAVDGTGRLIPVRDRQGRIVGVRLRIDGATSNKFRWLSGWPGGASIDGATVHHAMPAVDHGAGVIGVVEGEDKAEIAAARMGFPMLAIAGITLQANIAQAVRDSGARYAAIYFDRDTDPETRARVEAAEAQLARTLAAECPGVSVLQAVWPDSAGKGVDDCLLSGLTPFTRAHPALAATSEADRDRIAELERTAVVNIEEARRAREEARLISLVSSKNDLGGDVGASVAIRVANYAASIASRDNLQPGDVIPLIASRIASEGYDDIARRPIEAMARQTVGKRLTAFIEKGVIQTTPEPVTYTYQMPVTDDRGVVRYVEAEAKAPGLVWPGRVELLHQFADGSVLEPGQTRNRGGVRAKRLPIVCPHCENANVACTSCGSVFSSVIVNGHHVTLDTEIVAAEGAAPVERTPSDDTPAPVERPLAAEGSAPDAPPSNDGTRVVFLDGDDDDDTPAPVERTPEEEEARRRDLLAQGAWKHEEAARALEMLKQRRAEPRLVHGALFYNEDALGERAQARVAAVQREIEYLMLLENDAEEEAPETPETPMLFGPEVGGVAGFDRRTA